MTVSLSNFSGPLELLYHLVQKKEVDIYEIPIFSITEQFTTLLSSDQFSLENSAEFLNYSASLIWLKSKALLPASDHEDLEEEKWEDPHFEVIHHLVDYCKFKQAAHVLAAKEWKGFQRGGFVEPSFKRPFGIEHLTLDDIASLFNEVLSKSAANTKTIKGDVWRVSDKIAEIKNLLAINPKIAFHSLFLIECCKDELIALFLAVLELIKLGAIEIFKEQNSVIICKT